MRVKGSHYEYVIHDDLTDDLTDEEVVERLNAAIWANYDPGETWDWQKLFKPSGLEPKVGHYEYKAWDGNTTGEFLERMEKVAKAKNEHEVKRANLVERINIAMNSNVMCRIEKDYGSCGLCQFISECYASDSNIEMLEKEFRELKSE